MHPNATFAWTDREELLGFAAKEGFAHIFTSSDGGLFVVQAPLLVTAVGSIQFHVSRRNRIANHLAGTRVLISIVGRHAYQSANWYTSANQVPTWHYESVEIEGIARPLSHQELVAHLDALSDTYERRVQPEHPWTRAKMDPAKFDAMTHAIIGFELEPSDVRGTRKFNQHKQADDLNATVAGQRSVGRDDIADIVEELRERP